MHDSGMACMHVCMHDSCYTTSRPNVESIRGLSALSLSYIR